MVSFERESRWIRVNGILPESLGESDSRIRVQLLTLTTSTHYPRVDPGIVNCQGGGTITFQEEKQGVHT